MGKALCRNIRFAVQEMGENENNSGTQSEPGNLRSFWDDSVVNLESCNKLGFQMLTGGN